MVAIFLNVCLWRRSYAQNWEVLALKNCYSIGPPSYTSAVSVVASCGPLFFSTVRFGKIRATCENFLGKRFTAPPGKKFPVRLCKWPSFSQVLCYSPPLERFCWPRVQHFQPLCQSKFMPSEYYYCDVDRKKDRI